MDRKLDRITELLISNARTEEHIKELSRRDEDQERRIRALESTSTSITFIGLTLTQWTPIGIAVAALAVDYFK